MTSSDILRNAMKLAGEQRVDDALALLDEGLRAAAGRGSPAAIARLARAAAVLAGQHRGPQAEVDYYEQAVQAAPEDPHTLLALGDASAALGDSARAQHHWRRFAELATASVDPALHELLAAHLARRGTP